MEHAESTPIFTGSAKSDEIIAAVGDGVTVHDLDFRIIYQNQTMKTIFGDRVGEHCYQAYQQRNEVCPGCPIATCFSTGEVHTVERIVTIAERSLIFETCASPIRDKNGAIVAAVEVVRNATERKAAEEKITRLKNLYDALSRTNKAIMHIKDRYELFHEICKTAVEYGKLSLALIGELDAETGLVQPVAFSGTASRYMDSLTVSADCGCDKGRGPTGIAIRKGVPYVCNDFHGDPSTTPWRDAALENGIHSSAAFPLKHDEQTVGVLKVYSGQKGFFDQDIVVLLQEMGENISFAISNFTREERRRQAEEALRDSEERLNLVLEGSNNGFWDWNIGTGEVMLSAHFIEMLGHAFEGGRATIPAIMRRIHPDDRPRTRSVMHDQLSTTTSAFEVELRMLHETEEYGWFLYRGKVVSRDGNGAPLRVSGTASNITEKKRYEENLHYLSTHDPLTGLFNRGYFDAEMIRIAQGRQYPVSIVLADVDGLKLINDSFGHTEGDRIIRQAAQTLQQTFRGEDVVARIGGDEFAVILQNADADAVKEAIKRVRKHQEIINRDNSDYTLSISLGSATAERSDQLNEALKLADSRMYYYKFRRKLAQTGPDSEK